MKNLIAYFMAAMLLASCSQGEESGSAEVQHAISFSSAEAEGEEVSRAATPLNKSFQLYGFKKSATYTQTVFNDYTIAYAPGTAGGSLENSSNYYYIGAKENQTVKYWDMSAEQYLFFALCPHQTLSGATVFDASMTATLSIADTEGEEIPLYTDLQSIGHEDFGKVVQMKFKRPVSQVRYRFMLSNGIDASSVVVDGSSFRPANAAEKIYTAGTASVTYSASGTSLSFSGTTEFSENTIASAFQTPDRYYKVLPTGDAGYGSFILHAFINGEEKSVTVPGAFMRWHPNMSYTYIFKILDSTMTIVLVDVLVEPWQYGGYTEDEQHQW